MFSDWYSDFEIDMLGCLCLWLQVCVSVSVSVRVCGWVGVRSEYVCVSISV